MSSLRGARVVVTPFALLLAFGAPLRAQGRSMAPAGEVVGGISCDAQEGQRIHIHQHLVIVDHGTPVPIPPNVGQPAGKRCIYWVHTHTPDGFIHIEAPQDRTFTLGDFFTVWGQPLSLQSAGPAQVKKREAMKVWVDGKAYAKDPRSIPLSAHADIVIQVGPPYARPARFTAWAGL